jgi:hypothetical protein
MEPLKKRPEPRHHQQSCIFFKIYEVSYQRKAEIKIKCVYISVGWFLTKILFWMRITPGIYSFLCKSTENSKNKFFGQVTFWG